MTSRRKALRADRALRLRLSGPEIVASWNHDHKYDGLTAYKEPVSQAITQAAVPDVWLDFSLARFTIAQLQSVNTFGVCRYLSVVNSLTTKKIIWQPEYNMYMDAGIAVLLNYEWYTGRMAEGAPAGETDGSVALEQAKALGYPRGRVIPFSDDQCCTPIAACKSYMNGVHKGMSGYYKPGYYGPVDNLDVMLSGGFADFGWQPTAWDHGYVSPQTHLFQYFGGAPLPGTDLNHVLRNPAFPWYAGGTDMPLNPEDVAAIWAYPITNVVAPDADGKSPARSFITDIHKTVYAIKNDLADGIPIPASQVDDIVSKIIAQLPTGGGATPAQIETAMRNVLTNAFITPPPAGP